MRDSVKCFAHFQVDDGCCSSLIYECCNLVVEGHQTCQAQFALSEDVLPCYWHVLFLWNMLVFPPQVVFGRRRHRQQGRMSAARCQ